MPTPSSKENGDGQKLAAGGNKAGDIHFFNFANGCFPKSVPFGGYATLDLIAKLAKKNCGLGSRCIDATYDENADLKAACCGTIYSGFRAVGRFRVVLLSESSR